MTRPVEGISPIGFDGIPHYVAEHPEQIRTDLTAYFSSYTGRWFEHFSREGDPTRFDANDVTACAALSVPLDGPTLNGLWGQLDNINELLSRSPGREVTLAEVDTSSDSYTTLSSLYDTIRAIPGMGMVRTSKLLASKRPHLVPIRDSYVDALLGKPTQWWAEWRTVVENEPLVAQVTKLAEGVTPTDTSLLRIFDVVLWMEADRRAKTAKA